VLAISLLDYLPIPSWEPNRAGIPLWDPGNQTAYVPVLNVICDQNSIEKSCHMLYSISYHCTYLPSEGHMLKEYNKLILWSTFYHVIVQLWYLDQ